MTIAERRVLPQRRVTETAVITFRVPFNGARRDYTVSTGFFPDSRQPAEVFVTGAKVGTEVEATARDGAILISLALQHGISLEVMRGAITREENGEASTIVGAVLDMLYREKQT